ncbi:MAG TPA: aminotransferase class V-fold PLP-dependent enzyme [Candidatus Binatia bacterium]|nr:aminotransferase class V-fold PLP-dependent enzyme [Candidatus Binatia bacterium]
MNLDHNSGARVRPEVREAVADLLGRDLANPSSAHAAGRRARDAIESARDEVAALVNARPAEVVFTSGGTEANNLAVLGSLGAGDHVVSTAIEHASVLEAIERARECGARSTLVRPASDGAIAAADVAAALDGATRVVSVGWANGEIGNVQPIADIAGSVRARAAELGSRPLVHSDAVQAAGVVEVDFVRSGADLLTLSGHKLGALTGVGALVVRSGTALRPIMLGGPHERERRAGTENVVGIASFGVAARLASAEREERARRARRLRDRLWAGLAAAAAPVVRLGREDGLPTTLAIAFPGARGDALVLALDLAGIAASTGAACAAGAAEPSHVVRALGCSPEVAAGALRLSLGRDVGEDDVERAVAIVAAAVARARSERRARGLSDAA